MIKDFDLHNKMDERPNTDYRLYLCIVVGNLRIEENGG